MEPQKYDLTDIEIKSYSYVAEYHENVKTSISLIADKKYDEALNFIERMKLSCRQLKEKAVENNDENTANKAFILDEYLNLLVAITNFWKLCDSLDYQDAWSLLQDGINCLRRLQRFMIDENQLYIKEISSYLENIEKLYPYMYFNSIEATSKKKVCSICNRSPFDPECKHIAGNLYMGEMAIVSVKDVDFLGFSLVKNPMDKKCIVFMNCDKENIENTPFKLIHGLVTNLKRPFHLFDLKLTTRKLPRHYYNSWSKNSLCPCGSEIPFKDCCFNKDYVKNPQYEIHSKGQLRFS